MIKIHEKTLAAPLMIAFLLLLFLAILNVWFAFFTVPELGDSKLIAMILAYPDHFPMAKYFLGMDAMSAMYGLIWEAPSRLLPDTVAGPLGYIRMMGAVVMLACTLVLLKISRASWRVVLSVTTPIWLLFSIGYIEYYPFIAGLYLIFLYWIFSQPLTSHPAASIGAACSLLPLVYAGFAPYALIVLAVYLYGAGWRKWLVTLATASAAFLATIWLLWDGGIFSFFIALLKDLPLGEKNTLHEAYRGLSAGNHSIFFSLDYVFSIKHLREVLQMLFGGVGLVAMCLLPIAGAKMLWRRADWTRNDVLALIVFCWSLAYVLLMLPRLGPVKDIDLFFPCYLLFAFIIGRQVEVYPRIPRFPLLAVWLSGSIISVFYLLGLKA